MKKLLFSLIAALALVSACQTFDDSEIQSRIDEIELRLTQLENQINDNAKAISKIVNAVTVSSVVAIENGFTVTFSDGKTYTITNGADGADGANGADGTNGTDGKDGVTPTVGVKYVEGVLYWTINGEIAVDDKGNKVPCQTEPKLTPEFKIVESQWYCSFDGGENWTKVTTGGQTSVISFEDNDTTIVFTIDGQRFTIPKAAVFSLKVANDYLCLNPSESMDIAFTLEGWDESVHFEIEGKYYTAVVNEDAKTITFTAPDASVDTGTNAYIVIKAIRNSDGAVSAQYIGFEKGEITVIGDYFEVPVAGGSYEVKVKTNMSYTTEFDVKWINFVGTKAVREDVLNVAVDASKTFMERIGKLTITSAKGEKFVTVFKQEAYDDGETMGVPQRPYVINSLEDMLLTPSRLIKNNDIEVYFELGADIDMNNGNFILKEGDNACLDPTGEYPIHFDGKGHKILNFSASSGSVPSFFGCLIGHVSNLTFDGAQITATNEKGAVVAATVGLTGWGRDNAGYLENVHVINSSVTHTFTDLTNTAWVGQSAIVAAELMCEGSYIKNCSATDSSVEGMFCIGGIAAQADNGTLIDGCFVKGSTITGVGVNPGYDASRGYQWNPNGWIDPVAYNDFNVECGYIGGIVAMMNFSTVQNCYNDYATSASLNGTGRYAGGIAGVLFAKAKLINCWAGCYANAGVNAGGVFGGTAWYCGGGNYISGCIAWNRYGYTEPAVIGGNDSGNVGGNIVDPNNKTVGYYGLSELYSCYYHTGFVLTAGAWGTGTWGPDLREGSFAGANLHGKESNDIIATANAIGWDTEVWDLTGDLPRLAWEADE